MRFALVPASACLLLGFASWAPAQTVNVKVDIDTTRVSGTDTSGAIVTEPGYTSFDTTNVAATGTNIIIDGITFELFGISANASRLRPDPATGAPNDNLLRDFVFNEGAANRAVGLRVTGLPVGTYEMQSYHYDSTGSVTTTENFIQVEVRDRLPDNTTTPSMTLVDMFPFGTSPATSQFEVTTAGIKEFIFREDDAATATDPVDQNRARLNAWTIATVPEPSAAMTLLAGAACTLVRRRRPSRGRGA